MRGMYAKTIEILISHKTTKPCNHCSYRALLWQRTHVLIEMHPLGVWGVHSLSMVHPPAKAEMAPHLMRRP